MIACASQPSAEYTNPAPRQPRVRSAAAVEVLSIAPTDRPFKEIGLVKGQSVDELRTNAASMGCEAVLITERTATRTDADFGQAKTTTHGACLMFKDEKHALTEAETPHSRRCKPYKDAIFAAKTNEERNKAVRATPTECHRTTRPEDRTHNATVEQ